VRRGASLTRQLLTFSRRQPFNPTVIDLRSRIDGVRAMLGSSTGAAVGLSVAALPDTWPVKVDASEFDLALVNLSLNGRDAMPNGGSIVIASENVTLSASDTPAGLEGEFVAVRVSDTGSGIAPDILPKVFDPFFTTKQETKGSGLGLSQVYGFVHQSGGTVTIASELGRGTTVTLYLPRAVESVAEDGAAEEAQRGEGHVLLVEDNPEVAAATASLLDQLGYSVAQARDAMAALQAIDTTRFDLVVSDVMMPGAMDGLALARALRERHPEVPVVLVTGYHQLADEAGREFTLVRKPFDLSDLGRAAYRALSMGRQGPDSNVIPLQLGPKVSR
jgi:CheY-like chemotaxis protein